MSGWGNDSLLETWMVASTDIPLRSGQGQERSFPRIKHENELSLFLVGSDPLSVTLSTHSECLSKHCTPR